MQANTKMAQAIFLPGAWGKIPVFMGKNHPTPGGCYGFSHAQNYPPFTRRKNFLKIFKKYVDFCFYMLIILSSNQQKRVAVHSQKGGLNKMNKQKLSVSVREVLRMYYQDYKCGTANARYNNVPLIILSHRITKRGYGDMKISVEKASSTSKLLNRGAVAEALTNRLLDCHENDKQNSGMLEEYAKAQAMEEDLNVENHSAKTLKYFGLPNENLEIKYLTGCTKGAEINARNKDAHVLALVSETSKTKGGYYLLKKADLVLDKKTGKVKYESAKAKSAKYLKRLSKYAGFEVEDND